MLQKRMDGDELRSLKHYNLATGDFLSNDYLGVARHTTDFIPSQPHSGSTGSRLISGNSSYIEEFEEYLAHYYQAPAALYFSSGFDANLGLMAYLPQKGDTILYDQLSHASIREGIRLSHATSFAFKHNDLEDFQKRAKRATGDVFVVVESVYSMDGDLVPLSEFIEICHQNSWYLIVDEAHGTGVLGEQAKGMYQTVEYEKIFARIHTFGKALGSHGATIVGSQELRNFLINFCRSFIYTTAPSNASAESAWHAHKFMQHNLHLHQALKDNITYFHQKAAQLNIPGLVTNPQTPIQQYLAPKSVLKTLEYTLQQKGLSARAIYSPTVPQGQERLRISLHAYNTQAEIDLLLNTIATHV
ncbi:MAG: aminotransferase class I/II-fold pyridoxal phosphate-dependent enzyme [Weeksellaceae bacterium]|nr:aminotransferase class I/II-fold pyridoxal phosphate-dependent enzyme [Weeksellaceae bacterium]